MKSPDTTRRSFLQTTAATTALVVAPAILASGSVPPDPVIDAYAIFLAAQARYERALERANVIDEQLPANARGLPIVDRTLEIFRNFPKIAPNFHPTDSVMLEDIRSFNQREDIREGARSYLQSDPDIITRARADAEARLDWWKATKAEKERLRTEHGVYEAEAEYMRLNDIVTAALDAIIQAEPTTLQGALTKLSIVVRDIRLQRGRDENVDPEGMEWHERATVRVLADFERMIGGAA